VDPTEPRFPHLRIVPTARLLLHEECDPERVERLGRLLGADGMLRNPPIAAPLEDGTYVVLDGANRVTALRHLGVPDQVVQVVDYDDPGVQLDTWAHLLRDDGFLVQHVASSAGAWRALEAADEEGLTSRETLRILIEKLTSTPLPGSAAEQVEGHLDQPERLEHQASEMMDRVRRIQHGVFGERATPPSADLSRTGTDWLE